MDLSNGQLSTNKHDLTNGLTNERKPLKLYSPNGGDPLIFSMSANDKNSHLVALEIVETIK